MGLLLVLGLNGLVFGGGCAILASNKNRDVVGWFVLGFLFSLVALLVIVGLSPLEATPQTKDATETEPRTSGETIAIDDLRQKAALLSEELARARAKLTDQK